MVSKLGVNGQLAPLDGNCKEVDLDGRKDVVKHLMATGKQIENAAINSPTEGPTLTSFHCTLPSRGFSLSQK